MIESEKTIKNAWLCQVKNLTVLPVFADLTIEAGKIKTIQPKDFSTFINQNETTKNGSVDLQGRIVTLPLVNFHDHFYSRLAKGLPAMGPMDNFENVLKNLWWKLDLALEPEMIAASAQMSVLESIRNGVTYIFDHHASPAATGGSLTIIRDELKKNGLRAVLCFETSDRNGELLKEQALIENLKFIENGDADFKGMLGLHASFTITDQTLVRSAEIVKQTGAGIHIHLNEGGLDRTASFEKFGLPPVQRLERAGLLSEKAILAHGIDLIEVDYQTIKNSGCAIVYNPDSNLNNSVGLANFRNVPKKIPILTGTDGMHANIARSLKQLFLLYRHAGASFDEAFSWFQKIYFDQLRFVRKYFSDFPMLNLGDRADLIVWDYVPPTPISSDNFWGHFIYGILERPVRSVMQQGEWLLKDFQLTKVDEEKIERQIYQQGEKLYHKFSNLK